MKINWTKPIAGLMLCAATIGLMPIEPAEAQYTTRSRTTVIDIPEAFDRAFFEHDKPFFTNRTLGRQLDWLFFSYPENEIMNDGELLNTLYYDVLNQQLTSDPYIRTPDLPNPFGSSLLTLPQTGAAVRQNTQNRGELVFERPPLR